MSTERLDITIITELVKPGSRVLDLGCGEGDLLAALIKEKKVLGQGIEIDPDSVRKCIEKGLNVTQENIENGLNWYPDSAFDYVILNQSMQQVLHVDKLLKEAFRVGKYVIVGFPNFANLEASPGRETTLSCWTASTSRSSPRCACRMALPMTMPS